MRIVELEIVYPPVMHTPVNYCDLDIKEGAINLFEKDEYLRYQLEYRFCIKLKGKYSDP